MRIGLLVVLGTVLGMARMSIAEEAKPAPAPTPGPRFALSKETTYVTGPVRADGTIDYVGAINERLSKGVTKENNAAILMLEALTTGDGAMEPHYAKVRQKLGIAAPALARKGGELPPTDPPGFDETLTGPWTAEKAPRVAEWLTSMDGQLKLLVEASKRDHYYLPLVREQESDPLVAVLLPHLNNLRRMAHVLRSRAMLRLGNEDMEGFCGDAMAIVRLGRLSTHAPTLVEQLVGTGCEAMGLEVIRTAATGGWLSEAQVERLLRELRAAPAPRRMYDVFEGGERGFLLEMLQAAAVHGVGEAQKMLGPLGVRNNVALPPVDPVAKDWNAALRKANGWYDRLAEAGKKPSYAERMRSSAEVMRDIEALAVKNNGWRGTFAPIEDRLIALVMPTMERAYTTETRIAVERDLTETALALSGFRSRTAEYPPDLKLLVPGYFKVVPVDRFTDRPLVYRLEGNGYLLMSEGPDGTEGGGKSDDLVVEVRK